MHCLGLSYFSAQVRAEALRSSRNAFRESLLQQGKERQAAREHAKAEPLAERQAREREELRLKLAVAEAHTRKLAEARAAGVSDKALRAAGLL